MDIYLRALEPEDADFLYRAENELTATANSDNAAPYSQNMLREYALLYDADPLRSGQLRLVAEDHLRNPIGLIDYFDISARNRNASLGVLILPEFRGMGYGTAMIEEGAKFAMASLGLSSLLAMVHSDNEASIKAFGNAGFICRGTLTGWHFSNGILHDVVLMQYSANQ